MNYFTIALICAAATMLVANVSRILYGKKEPKKIVVVLMCVFIILSIIFYSWGI